MGRDKYLTEAMDKPWHDEDRPKYPPDYSSWLGFGELWEWAIKQEWWDIDFLMGNRGGYIMTLDKETILVMKTDLINPDKFADALYKFLIERRKP